MSPVNVQTRQRRKRILLLAMHPGYVRNYEETIRLLLDAGHDVHVATANPLKQSDDRVAERLANEYANLTISQAPKSPRGNVNNLRRGLRGLADYIRYQHPRFADAEALRKRGASKLLNRRHVWGLLPAVAITLYLPTLGRLRNARYADAASKWALRMANRLPPPRVATRWLESLAPDVFLTTPHVAVGSSDPEFLDAARVLGIPSVLLVASWDNLTNKGLIKSTTDLVVVWNETQRREAIEMHRVPADRIAVTGAQRFDEWFEMSASGDRGAFVEHVGLDPARPYILYLCSSPFISPDEVPFVRRLATALRASDSPLAEAGLLVRPHPQNAHQWAHVDFTEYGNAVIWPREGQQPVRESSKRAFYDSMCHSLAVVGINTSAQIEAGIIGRTVHTVLDPDFGHAHDGTLHFRYLLAENGGLLYVAADIPELLRNLGSVFAERDHDQRTKAFVQSFVRPHGLARPASPIVADVIERLLDGPPQSAVKRERTNVGERLLLAMLIGLSVPTDRKRLTALPSEAVRAIQARILTLRGTVRVAVRSLSQKRHRPTRRGGPPSEPADRPVVVEPWQGDLAGEMLYWIPSVRRYCRSQPRDTRVIVVTSNSDSRWYSTLRPEAVIDGQHFDPTGMDEALADVLGTSQPISRPRFYRPTNVERLRTRTRADLLPVVSFSKSMEFRSLLPGTRPTVPVDAAPHFALLRPFARDVVNAAEAHDPFGVVLRTRTGGGDPEAILIDTRDRVALTTALDGALAAVSTDLGVAALAVSMGVATMLVCAGDSCHNADLDVLDRVADTLEVDLEIVDPAAMRMLLPGEPSTPADAYSHSAG